MDKQEAKLILQSYRINGKDASDPAFTEALHMAANDPELREWFEREQSIDTAIGGKLEESPIPDDLLKAIIAGIKRDPRIVRPAHAWWKSPALAWAAAIVIVFGAAFLIQDNAPQPNHLAIADYRLTMRQNLDTLSGFDLQESEPAKIKVWLNEQGIETSEFLIPDSLIGKKSLGCKLFQYNGTQSALICFQLPNMEMVHLFVINKSAVGEVKAEQPPELAKCGNWDTCSWENGENLYLLLGKVGTNTLQTLANCK